MSKGLRARPIPLVFLEPVLQDGLHAPFPSATFAWTSAAHRRASRAVIREFREIFLQSFWAKFSTDISKLPYRVSMTRGCSGETGTAPTGSGKGCNQP